MAQTKRPFIFCTVLPGRCVCWLVGCALLIAGGCSRAGMMPDRMQTGWRAVPEIQGRIIPPKFPDREFIVTGFGAVADGRTDARPSFKKAIDQCNAEGGGRVVVPAGNYQLNGPIHLKSNVHLNLQRGAYIQFSSNPADYLPVVLTRWEGTEIFNYSPLVYAYQATNVAITGEGTLDGNGKACFAGWEQLQAADVKQIRMQNNAGVPVSERIYGEGHFVRPNFVQFFDCKNVLVEGIRLVDSPFWVTHFVGCKNVTVRRLNVYSHTGNSDGVDPESSVDVLIEDCVFDTEDDSVAIKSGRDRDAWRLGQASENIIVRRCKIKTNKSGLCIGSEMGGGARNIFWEDCTIDECINGLFFKSNGDRGGRIEDVWVRDIKIGRAQKHAVLLTCDYNGAYLGGKHWPLWQRLNISDLSARETGLEGILLIARPEMPMRDIRLTDITIGKEARPSQFNHIENLSMKDVRVSGSAAGTPGASAKLH